MSECVSGKIIKGIAGFYYVHVSDRGIFECKAKGGFRNQNIKPLVGDNVEIDIVDNERYLGNIVNILPRQSELIRPAVANVDQALLVFAMSEPAPNLRLLDNFLVMMDKYGLETIICFNKFDESSDSFADELMDIYKNCGSPVVITSTRSGEGMDKLRELLANKTTALAGPSGVGKSSILNELLNEATMETGSISEKIGRGKHTTRHSEVFVLEDGAYILDTPGFTSLSVFVEEKEDLRFYIHEFEQYEGQCKFNGCVHVNEPKCAVKQAVEDGCISKVRYDHYVDMYNEIGQKNNRNKEKTDTAESILKNRYRKNAEKAQKNK